MRTGTSARCRRLSLAATLLLAVGGVVGGGAALPRAAVAQTAVREAGQPAMPVDENGVPAARPARQGFELFALGDLAVAGLTYSGQMTFGMTNYGGPCSDAQALTRCGWINRAGSLQQRVFEIVFTAAAGVTDFRKVRTAYAGVNNMLPPSGYTMISNADLLSRPRRWGPADNSGGRLFSGAATKADGSCLDKNAFAGGRLSYSVTLMAVSNCPPTWPASGFDGARPIADTTFATIFRTLPDSFHFDFWRVPKSRQDQTQFLGDVSSYGETSDHYAEILKSYGSVTPKGSGNPTIGGFPLGLDVRFDAFNFGRPELASVVFYQMTVVNNSALVYGKGIDYDSLYMGLSPGFTNTNSSLYYVPQQNALKVVAFGVNAGCNGATAVAGVTACPSDGGFRNNNGFAIVVLKSPIGDTRNKLLTKAGSAFFRPTSPFADDTITFNHGHYCDFGSVCEGNTVGTNGRRGFGLASSTEANVLDGRDAASLSSNELWFTFRNKTYVNGQVSPAFAQFNRFVPTGTTNLATGQPFGSWDYNNDGKPDTLFLDSCAERGCVAAFGDTLPGKQRAGRSQVGGQLNAGPFKLKAGDTTSFIYAFVGSTDSTGLELGINNAIDSYLNFYLSPRAPTAPRIVAVETRSEQTADLLTQASATTTFTPLVRLTLSNDPETSRDAYLEKYARDLASATGDSSLIILRQLNPGLADEILARALPVGTVFRRLGPAPTPADTLLTATGNFSEVDIFKSCDNGATWTATADCRSAPARDVRGAQIGLGYQAYAVLKVDATGHFTKTYTDPNVSGGRTYLYSAVPRSRGFMRAVTIRSPNSTAQRDTVITVADTVSGVLATQGSSTAKVYVPITAPAGATGATATVTRVTGTSTLPVTVRVGENAKADNYRLYFANQFRVTTTTTLATGQTSTVVVARRNYAAATYAGKTTGTSPADTTYNPTNFAADSAIFTASGPVETSGLPTPTVTTTQNATTKTVVSVYTGLGYVLADSKNVPYLISASLTPAGSQPANFLSSAAFPGFTFELTQARSDTLVLEQIVQANGDTVPTQLRDNNAVQFRQESSTRQAGRGTYQFVFKQDAFGPDARNFTLTDVPGLQAQLDASIAARQAVATGNTSSQILGKIASVVTSYAGKTLAPIKFPFVVLTPSGDTAILAALPRSNSTSGSPTTLLFGNGQDTLRINAPADSWVPGDRFVILEKVTRDSVAGGKTVFPNSTTNVQSAKQAIQVTDTVVAFGPAVLGCNTPRETCNPVKFGTRGATGYLVYDDKWKLVIDYPRPFTFLSEVALAVSPTTAPQGRLTKADMKSIRVVPNPYVVVSDVDKINAGRAGEPRLLFTGVPQEGVLRIYSVSGQFLQQLVWTPADLNGTGDLAWNLVTREGTDVAAGLYIYVITAKGANAGSPVARGKFVIIR